MFPGDNLELNIGNSELSRAESILYNCLLRNKVFKLVPPSIKLYVEAPHK